jgi:RNA polymerase sigma factor (sigma-70 family)
MRDDSELLRDYVRENSEESFTALVDRYLNLVYSAALRQVRSPQLAEEVAQSTFTDLAHTAHSLPRDTILPAWLYKVARRTAIDIVRRESRRLLREQAASQLTAMNATTADWAAVEPLLDEAMHALDDTDRAAVLLRYFENKSLRDVGQALGTTEDAAQKRVSRAVDRLREFLSKRGVTVATSGLVVLVSAHAVQAAPIGLSAAISATALAGTAVAAAATTTVTAATKGIAMTTLQKTLIGNLCRRHCDDSLILQYQTQVKLRAENQALRQQADELLRLQAENERLSQTLASSNSSEPLPKEQFSELLKLVARSEHCGGRRTSSGNSLRPTMHLNPLASQGGSATAPESVPKESWAFIGYADPESALQSTIWAMNQGDTKTYLASLIDAPELRGFGQAKTETELGSKIKGEFEK